MTWAKVYKTGRHVYIAEYSKGCPECAVVPSPGAYEWGEVLKCTGCGRKIWLLMHSTGTGPNGEDPIITPIWNEYR